MEEGGRSALLIYLFRDQTPACSPSVFCAKAKGAAALLGRRAEGQSVGDVLAKAFEVAESHVHRAMRRSDPARRRG